MRVLLYEWCCSGGLVGGDDSIAAEGRMMLEALVADAAKNAALEIAVLVDTVPPLTLPPQARIIPVPPGHDAEALVAAALDADWTIIVAPESDGILLDRIRRVRAAGGRVVAPQDRVIDVCSDKQATIDALAAHGVPVPAGRALEPGMPIPPGFHMPAVRKARTGCGCADLSFVSSSEVTATAVPTRLEAFVQGTPVGVSLLAGPLGPVALPPMQQRFSVDDSPRYLGSDVLADDEAAALATALATRAAHAIDADGGWIGVDLVLGERPDGRDDRVLEINPRMTTSIAGQTSLFASSLVAAMIEAAEGRSPCLERAFSSGPRPGSFSLPVA